MLEVRLAYVMAPDIAFRGLGSVPFSASYETENNLLLGTVRTLRYDDGYLAQDYLTATLVGGGDSGAQRIPSPNTAATANFGYRSADQLDPADPAALLFHRYAAVGAADAQLDGSASGALGWEINYTRYLTKRRNLGLQVGFGFSGFDSRFNDSVPADLYIKEYRHRMADGAAVPPLPDPVVGEDGTVTQPPYAGPVVREETDPANLLSWIAGGVSEDVLEAGATVETRADLRSSIYNFRAGPTYDLALGRRFAMRMGAGVSAVYYTGQFSAYEVLQNPSGGENPSRALTTTTASEFQVAGYLDASAHYRINQRVSLFSGLQMQSGNTYTQYNEEREARVDFSTHVSVHAGLGIRF